MTVRVLAGLITLTSPASAGGWKYQVVPNDGHVLAADWRKPFERCGLGDSW
jgi:hypothetical protein